MNIRTAINSVAIRLLALMLAGGIALCIPARAAAEDTPIPCQVTSDTPFGSEGRRQIQLNCDLAERGALDDRLTIITGSGSAGSPATWPAVADLGDAVWIFDYQGNSTVELMIVFRRDGPALVAELYDAQQDPSRLNYTLNDGEVTFNNQLSPTVRVTAPGGWWTRGELINFNLDISVDGLLDAAFDMRAKLRKYVKTDEIVDFVIRIRDTNENGRPNYDWRTVNPPVEEVRALQRTFITVNTKDDEAPLVPTFPWPYLGQETYGYLTASAHDTSQPPIQVNWDTGTITAVGEFVTSRGNDAQWFVYSFEEVKEGQMNWPNFESPFAWYDLAEDQDRQPELAVRLGYYWADDVLFVKGQYPYPINFVRYSWDQDNNGYWDYKLGLLGSHEITSTVAVDNLRMGIVPYEQLPQWVIERSWPVVTFVAAEGVRARGEGIYEWDPSTWLTEQYYTGRSDSAFPPPESPSDDKRNLRVIPAGFRGEYQLDLGGKLWLYISAIDHKLHLLRAQEGIWNIDEHSTMRYANPDGDPYLDQWRYSVDGELQSELNLSNGYLVYSDRNEVSIKRVQVPPASAQLQPPHGHAEWLALGEKLASERPTFKPTDLRAMLDQFAGLSWQIANASIRDFRPDGNGFRFVLELQPGFHAGESDPLNLAGLQAGLYVVTFDGSFHVRPLTPPALSLALTLQQLEGAGSAVNTPLLMHARAANTGLEDARNLTLVAEAHHGERSIEIARQSVDVLSQNPVDIDLTWQPTVAGTWVVEVRLEDQTGYGKTTATLPVEAAASKEGSQQTILSASTGDGQRLVAYLVLVALAVCTGLAVRLNRARTQVEAEP